MDSIDNEPPKAGSERRDNWYVIKGIPVAVLLGLFVHGASFAWYLSALNAQVQQQSREQAADRAEWRTALGKLEAKVDGLGTSLQGNSVPTALNQRRIEETERQLSQIQSTLSQLSNRVAENERRLSTESIRNRAARER